MEQNSYICNNVLFLSSFEGSLQRNNRLGEYNLNRENRKILIGGFLSATITWYINNTLGYGPIIANGIVGIVVSLLLAPKLAGAYYVASFVGMSNITVIPSMVYAGFGGLFAATVIVFSTDIYGGIGGKGGTIATLSTLLTKGILYLIKG